MGFGFGIRNMLSKTTFLQVEVSQVDYKNVTFVDGASVKPNATVGTIGFGMKF